MAYTDLLRATVFLGAAAATALAALAVLIAGRDADSLTVYVGGAWWLVAFAIGAWAGRPAKAADGVRDLLAAARTATSLPPETPARIAAGRLWPTVLIAVVAGALGIFFAGIPAIAAGYFLLLALELRSREGAVLAIEQRDGVKFYVVPNSPLRPVRLVRTPGLRSIRT